MHFTRLFFGLTLATLIFNLGVCNSVLARVGGSSDGTGNFAFASDQDIIKAAQQAQLQITTVIFDFHSKDYRVPEDFGKMVPAEIMFVISPVYLSAVISTFNFYTGTPIPGLESVEFRKAGACDGPDGAQGAGSVTHRNGKLHLCLSLQRLRAIPTDYLVEEIAILLAHEAAHVVGQDETVARKVQAWFAAYSKVRLDIAAFAFFPKLGVVSPGYQLKSTLESAATSPVSSVCRNQNWGDEARELDHAMKELRAKTDYFQIHWPNVNQPEFWERKMWSAKDEICRSNATPEEIQKKFLS